MTLPIGTDVAEMVATVVLCSDIGQTKEDVNARSTQGNSRGRGGLEVWRRMYLDDSDLYYRVLALRLRQVLATKKHKNLCLFVATNSR